MSFDDFAALESLPPAGTKAKPEGLVGDALRMNPDHIKVVGYTERCPSCKGRGRFISWSGRDCGPCFKCQGKGSKSFKTSPEARAKSREQAANAKVRKQREHNDKVHAWAEEHKDLVAYLASRAAKWDFAASLLAGLAKYGSLTERQLAAAQSAMARDAARSAPRPAPAPQPVPAPEYSEVPEDGYTEEEVPF